MKIYKEKELDTILAEKAYNLEFIEARWYQASLEHHKKFGDQGSCVLGDGIYVHMLPKGTRTRYVKRFIMRPPYPVQGECTRHAGYQAALDTIRFMGIEAKFDAGVLD